MMEAANHVQPAYDFPALQTVARKLQNLIEIFAAVFLAADLLVVLVSVISRYVFNFPLVWADDVARSLMLAMSFFGATAAMARGEQAGVTFFIERLSPPTKALTLTLVGMVGTFVTLAFCWYSYALTASTFDHTVGAGIPQSIFFVPMLLAAAAMVFFALVQLVRQRVADIAKSAVICLVVWGAWMVFAAFHDEAAALTPTLMGIGFLVSLAAGMPIGFVLAFAALIYVWTGGILPGEIFSQQMARGIDNFVLLAVPFFILVGYVMEANGMSIRLIALLQRLVGRVRGGLNVVMILGMVIFSGISGSKIADVAAVGSVLIPAARKSKQNPAEAVALLASSAIMGETIPPCINLIILGFVANVSIGGLFMAGLLPAALMAIALITFAIIFGTKAPAATIGKLQSISEMAGSAVVVLGLIVVIFGSFRSGFATATEASAFAALYALIVGVIAFRELSFRSAVRVFKDSAARAGMVMFIIAAAQSLAYTLTIQQLPHALADAMIAVTSVHGVWLFMLLSILILIVMGAVLEGAAALIIFGPLLMPVAKQLGVDPLHYGIVLVIGMGIGLFAPPLGLGLYSSCLIGGVRMEETVKPMLKYLGILFVCYLVIAYVPWISTAIPRAMGY